MSTEEEKFDGVIQNEYIIRALDAMEETEDTPRTLTQHQDFIIRSYVFSEEAQEARDLGLVCFATGLVVAGLIMTATDHIMLYVIISTVLLSVSGVCSFVYAKKFAASARCTRIKDEYTRVGSISYDDYHTTEVNPERFKRWANRLYPDAVLD